MGYIGVITHLLTIDPNFLGHPSMAYQKFPIFWEVEASVCKTFGNIVSGKSFNKKQPKQTHQTHSKATLPKTNSKNRWKSMVGKAYFPG